MRRRDSCWNYCYELLDIITVFHLSGSYLFPKQLWGVPPAHVWMTRVSYSGDVQNYRNLISPKLADDCLTAKESAAVGEKRACLLPSTWLKADRVPGPCPTPPEGGEARCGEATRPKTVAAGIRGCARDTSSSNSDLNTFVGAVASGETPASLEQLLVAVGREGQVGKVALGGALDRAAGARRQLAPEWLAGRAGPRHQRRHGLGAARALALGRGGAGFRLVPGTDTTRTLARWLAHAQRAGRSWRHFLHSRISPCTTNTLCWRHNISKVSYQNKTETISLMTTNGEK